MSGYRIISLSDQLLIGSINVLFQVTLISAIALAIAAAYGRRPTSKYWVLCSALLLILLCPATATVMQSSGRGLLKVSLNAPAATSQHQQP